MSRDWLTDEEAAGVRDKALDPDTDRWYRIETAPQGTRQNEPSPAGVISPGLMTDEPSRRVEQRPSYRPRVVHDQHENPGWLWPRRFRMSRVGAIGGPKDVGKSSLLGFIAAMVTRGGGWPDGGIAPKGRVLLFSGEISDESFREVFAIFHGQDELLKVVPSGELVINRDPDWLCGIVNEYRPVLVLVDNIDKFVRLPREMSVQSQTVSNDVLGPLVALAKDLAICLVYTRHMTEANQKAKKYTGSRAWTNFTPYTTQLVFERNENLPAERRARTFRHLHSPKAADPPAPITWLTRHEDFRWRECRPSSHEDRVIVEIRNALRPLARASRGRVDSIELRERLPVGISWRRTKQLMRTMGGEYGRAKTEKGVIVRGGIWSFPWPPLPGSWLDGQ